MSTTQPHATLRQQAQEQVRLFETRYNCTLAHLLTQGLPDDADYQMHEDFIEWEYWQDVLNEAINNPK
ncbi:MAG: hypothetical protein OT477_13050 [Chloroflexi bacterium]|nr:hypothetical protein [Chloroflexota bacterium]